METISTTHPVLKNQQSLSPNDERDSSSLEKTTKELALSKLNAETFGPKEWKRVFEVNIGESTFGKDLIDFWLAVDALNPHKKNYETHFAPIHCPQLIAQSIPDDKDEEKESDAVDNSAVFTPYNLQTLTSLSEIKDPEMSIYKSIHKTEPPCWLIVRKDLLFKNLNIENQVEAMNTLNQKTKVDYEPLPSALQIGTFALVHHVAHKKCFFISAAHTKSVSLCKDRIFTTNPNPHLHVGCSCIPYSTPNKFHQWNGLSFDSSDVFNSPSNHVGVLAVKKFNAPKNQEPAPIVNFDGGWEIIHTSQLQSSER